MRITVKDRVAHVDVGEPVGSVVGDDKAAAGGGVVSAEGAVVDVNGLKGGGVGGGGDAVDCAGVSTVVVEADALAEGVVALEEAVDDVGFAGEPDRTADV